MKFQTDSPSSLDSPCLLAFAPRLLPGKPTGVSLLTALTLTCPGPGLLEAFDFGGTVTLPKDVYCQRVFIVSPAKLPLLLEPLDCSCLVIYCFPFPQ